MIVCLDTHILIWGIKKESELDQQAKIEQATRFLQWLENEGHEIIVPAPVLGEFLMRVPTEQHPEILSLFQNNFIVPPFDALCASEFARIWQHKYGLKSDGLNRREIKIDSMIIAIAIINGAAIIYSEDKGLKKVADESIEVRDMPHLPSQLKLI